MLWPELPHTHLSRRPLDPLLWLEEPGGPSCSSPKPLPPSPSRYNGPNLVLKYDRAQKRLVNIAVDERSSPYYALRDRQGNAIGVTACDIDGDGREEIYFLNTNNAFSGKVWDLAPLPASHLLPPNTKQGGPSGPRPSSGCCHDHPQAQSPAAPRTALCPSRGITP